MRLTKASAVARVDGEVCRAKIISTPVWMGTGFIKWVDMTREAEEGEPVEAAILVMEMEEVLVLRMACWGVICASCENMEVFREGISGTASMMKSAFERSSILVEGVRKERAASASDWEMRCLETSFARSFSEIEVSLPVEAGIEDNGIPANWMPLSKDACELSTKVTGT